MDAEEKNTGGDKKDAIIYIQKNENQLYLYKKHNTNRMDKAIYIDGGRDEIKQYKKKFISHVVA